MKQPPLALEVVPHCQLLVEAPHAQREQVRGRAQLLGTEPGHACRRRNAARRRGGESSLFCERHCMAGG